MQRLSGAIREQKRGLTVAYLQDPGGPVVDFEEALAAVAAERARAGRLVGEYAEELAARARTLSQNYDTVLIELRLLRHQIEGGGEG